MQALYGTYCGAASRPPAWLNTSSHMIYEYVALDTLTWRTGSFWSPDLWANVIACFVSCSYVVVMIESVDFGFVTDDARLLVC